MKKGPDRNNYQVWVIDYIDGNLDREREQLLLAFLEKNPDLGEEIKDACPLPSSDLNVIYPLKQSLKKEASDLSDSQFEMLCIASMENDLAGEEEEELRVLLGSDSRRMKIFNELSATRLKVPDLKYRHHRRLKRVTASQKIFRFTAATLSLAAGISLVLLVNYNHGVGVERKAPGMISENNIKGQELPSATQPVQSAAGDKGNANRINIPNHNRGTSSVMHEAMKNEPPVTGNPVQAAERTSPQPVAALPYRYETAVPGDKLAYVASAATTEEEEQERGPGPALVKFVKEKLLGKTGSKKGNLNGYDIADAGITMLNRTFGWDMTLKKNTDQKGEVRSVQFSSGLLKFNQNVKKSSSSL